MIEEIKRKLKGDRVFLKCINKEGFISKNEVNKEILNLEEIEVEYYQEEDVDFFGGLQLIASESFLEDKSLIISDMFIRNNEIEYFEIIESPYIEDNPTLNDLIDVAVQANKDKLIGALNIRDKYIEFYHCPESHHYGCNKVKEGIKFINSLYTETFVIKEFSDTKILKSGAKAVLGNGEELIFRDRIGDELWFEYNDCHNTKIPFIALKGATVTQQKGNK